MRAPTDIAGRRRRPARGRIVLVLVAVALFLLLVSLRGIAGFYTDYLWFDELTLTSVWRSVLGTKIALGVIFTLLFFALLWANLAIADLLAPTFRPLGPEEQLIERYHEVVGQRAGLVRVGVAAAFALIAGPGAASQWSSWTLFRNHVPFETRDALFDKDLGFFVFQLPFAKFVVDWLFASLVIVAIITAVAHYLNGGIRFQTPLQKVTPQVKAHLSVLMAVLAMLKAVDYYLEKYELVYSSRGVVQGASYTDVKAQLPAMQLLLGISLIAAALFIYNIFRRGWVLPVIAVGLWAMVSVVVGAAIPAAVQQFRVQPTESSKERPYIERNINATKAAYGLRDVQLNDFAADNFVTNADLAENRSTIENVRLWDPDPRILRETYNRLQQIRNFYQFNDVDIDRYVVEGKVRQELVSARELNIDGIPSQSWVNQHLVYTHGYGAVMTPSSAVEADGKPALQLKDLPPNGSPEIAQPAIYYGQVMGGYAIVNSGQREIDYAEANGTNHTTTYSGTGGVKIDSFIRRAALALRFGDINPLISSFVTSESRAIYMRDIDERVRKAAPFLEFDSDPYPIIYRDRIQWIYDAYTTTSRYPYSQQADTSRLEPNSDLNRNFNYVRNSVKVLIDAYDGKMTFFVVDQGDPIVKAWRKAFPKLFTDGIDIDPELEAHFRYPEDLFRVQTNMFGRYHISDPGDFYNNTDAWDIAQEPGAVSTATPLVPATDAAGRPLQAREPRMDPYYLLMRLPEEEDEDFLILQPFVPRSRDDSVKVLSAFMVAKSDPGNYGQLEAYVMPRNRQVDGPALVNARINQQPEVSQQITLLNTSGSKVRLGNLLLVPIEQSLLYIRPLYVEAEGTPLPQLKKVIVVFGERVVIRDSLRDAMTALFPGSSPSTLEQLPTTTPPPPPPGQTAPPTTTPPPPGGQPAPPLTSVNELLTEATARFNAAEEALKNGDLSSYQRFTNEARDLVRRAADATRSTSGTPPATTPTTRPTA
ncbi:MAG TPA: UPF0182 family protein [Acidimicrobiales bacterium]|nr:UPF0182 family protein [Acidimicrobiales bacterium]